MLTANGKKQEASIIYLHMLAASCGYSFEGIRIDMDSVDAKICAKGVIPGSQGIVRSPQIDVQLKATEADSSRNPLSFAVPKKNYAELRQHTMVPRILVVLFLPRTDPCFRWDPEKIALYGKAYWKSLKGMDPTENTSNVTVHLTEKLTDETLRELMIAAANREEFAYASR